MLYEVQTKTGETLATFATLEEAHKYAKEALDKMLRKPHEVAAIYVSLKEED